MPAKFEEDSPSVQAHLGIMQSVINRMASNSTSCKAWCITLVSAILVIVADKGKQEFGLIALIPTLTFCSLDAYYLSLEKRFRESYTSFVERLHNGNVIAADLYDVVPSSDWFKKFLTALRSYSVWPFYLTLLVMILLVKLVIIVPPAPVGSGRSAVNTPNRLPTSPAVHEAAPAKPPTPSVTQGPVLPPKN